MASKRGSISLTSVYRRKGSQNYYFKYTDKDGKRRQLSTGKTVKKDARQYAQDFIDSLVSRERFSRMTLGELIKLYTDPATNPRYKEAKVNTTNYTHRYALLTARNMSGLLKVLEERTPTLLTLQLCDLIRRDIKDIAAEIVEIKGRCRTAQMYFLSLKVALSQAESDGLVQASPAKGLPNIKYQEKRRTALSPGMISWMLSRKDLFPSEEYHAFLSVIAATGMRRGEALAINKEKLFNGVLTIDAQIATGESQPTLPKWGVVRCIPLPKLALEALERQPVDSEGNYFPHYDKWSDLCMGRLKSALKAADPDNKAIWDSLGHHVLRHSLNTNLIVEGVSPILIAEYLSWRHQELIDIQRRYTHIMAMKLKPVADAIDMIYSKPERDAKVINFRR